MRTLHAERLRTATQEGRSLDFKSIFDSTAERDWCELVKDLVAMANSAGGAILLGVNDDGTRNPGYASIVGTLDPAQVTDKVSRYTNEQFSAFSIGQLDRLDGRCDVITVRQSPTILVFSKEGAYSVGRGRQELAFRTGTVYVRHGAKSEPATSADLRTMVQRRVDARLRSVLANVKKAVAAGPEAEFAIVEKPLQRVLPLGPDAAEKSVGSLTVADLGGAGVEVRRTAPLVSALAPDGDYKVVKITDDPRAEPALVLNPDATHPYRQKELTAFMNESLEGRKTITGYDIQSVRVVVGVDSRPEWAYKSRYGTRQYSVKFAEWLVDEFNKNPGFFDDVRRKRADLHSSAAASGTVLAT